MNPDDQEPDAGSGDPHGAMDAHAGSDNPRGRLESHTPSDPDSHPSLAAVLGDKTIRDAVISFIHYLETAVSVHESNGVRAGELLTGNSFCDLLAGSRRSDESGSPSTVSDIRRCDYDRSQVALAAVANAAAQERTCFAGMILRAVPVKTASGVVGAVVGAISEVPADERTVFRAADEAGIDSQSLWRAAGKSIHKPDYLYSAARQHLDILAQTLGHFYDNSLEQGDSIKEILQRDQEQSQANRFLTGLLDGMAEAVYTTDNEGRFTYVNPAATTITGYTREEIETRNMVELVAPDELEKVKTMAAQRQLGEVHRYEIDIIHKDGHRLTISQNVAPLFEGDQIVGRVGVVNDVTERRQMEKDLLQQRRRLDLLQSVITHGVSRLTSGKALSTLAEDVSQILGYDYCSIFMPSVDGKTLELVARNQELGEDFEEINRSGAHDLDNPDFRRSPPARTFLTGEPIVMSMPQTASEYERLRKVAHLLRSRAMVSIPLAYQGERLGVMVIHSTEEHDFAEDELGFLQIVGTEIAAVAGGAIIYERLLKSEIRYRDLFDHAVDWMYSLSEDGLILDVNEAMARTLGWSREDILGKPIYDFEIESDRRRAKVDIKAASRSGVFTAERTFLNHSNARIVIDIHARMVMDHQDRQRWEVIGRDVTEKKESERRINLLAAAMENTQDGVVISDLRGDIISINAAGAGMFGYERAAMIGMHMGELWSDNNSDELREEILHASLKNGGWEGQMWYQRRDGDAFPVFVSSARVIDERDEPIAIVGIVRDLTEEQRMTEEVLRRNRELAVLNAIAVATSSTQDLAGTLKNSLDVTVKSMNYSGGVIFLADREGEFLKPAATTYPIPPQMKESINNLPVGIGHSGTIAATGEPLFIDDYVNSSFRVEPLRDAAPIASLGGVPLLSKENVLGVLVVSTVETHNFTESEKALLAAVGKSIGVAVENARLFDDIANAKAQWESTFDAMTNGISIHDRNYRIIRANKALTELLGQTSEEIIGKKCYEIFHGLKAPLPECPLVETIATGKHFSLILNEPFLKRTLSLSADPYYDERGDIIGCIHDVRDVTEQEQMRRQLAQSEKLRALGEMAGGVAHDFNNFLTVIIGNTQLLLAQGSLDSETLEALEAIQRASADAAETVRRIQEFTRVRTVRSFTSVDINQAVANAIEVSRPRWRDEAQSHGVRINMDVELQEVPPVNGNAAELGEVFLNLMLNAADAIPDGGKIKVRTGVAGKDMVEVIVSDDGQGMPPEVCERVFEPFYSTKGPQGSGLGLSLAFGIVTRHGGDISVESREGEGSVFRVLLPVAALLDLPDSEESLTAPGRAADDADEEVSAAAATGHGRVLVIEDETLVRSLLADILKQMGQDVETASTGHEGVSKFEAALSGARNDPADADVSPGPGVTAGKDDALISRQFDLVLTDLGMPEMSGWEVVKRIKAISPGTPVALITGWGDQLDPGKMKASGVDVVMAKPFSVADVKKLVAEAMAGPK